MDKGDDKGPTPVDKKPVVRPGDWRPRSGHMRPKEKALVRAAVESAAWISDKWTQIVLAENGASAAVVQVIVWQKSDGTEWREMHYMDQDGRWHFLQEKGPPPLCIRVARIGETL